MRAVVLAAGEGKRMRPLTAHRPKVMLPVAGKPILAWLLQRAERAGVREFIVVTHYQEDAIRDYFRMNPMGRAKVSFVHQEKPMGTGDGLRAAAKRAGKEFLLLYGDTLPAAEDLSLFVDSPEPLIGAWKVEDPRPYGALEVSGKRLRRISEKSSKPPSNLINAGVYRLNADFLGIAGALSKSSRGEYEFTDAVNEFVQEGSAMRVVRLREWREAGRPWDLLGLQESLMSGLKPRVEGDVERGVVMHGPVVVGKGTKIRAGTYIEGPVIIGRDCKIGPNAYLRPSTSIGDGCHIGASVEIKNSIIMDRSNVPHLSYIGDSVLGSDVNLGAGTSVANLKVTPTNVRATLEDGSKIDTGRRKLGAIVGDGTKIGINCSLNPGTIVGADCVIGLGRSLAGWTPTGSRLF